MPRKRTIPLEELIDVLTHVKTSSKGPDMIYNEILKNTTQDILTLFEVRDYTPKIGKKPR